MLGGLQGNLTPNETGGRDNRQFDASIGSTGLRLSSLPMDLESRSKEDARSYHFATTQLGAKER